MLFKGTPTTKPEEYSQIIAKNGGRSNAFTISDVAVYFAAMSREKIGIQLELEADPMVNALLGDAYFEPEKKVIQEKRRLRTDDNPVSALSEVADAVADAVHPYRRPVIGLRSSIASRARCSVSWRCNTARLKTDSTSASNNSGASKTASSITPASLRPKGVRRRYSVAADASIT
jgi:secreted Zn-dependent insulinase-like peptidase